VLMCGNDNGAVDASSVCLKEDHVPVIVLVLRWPARGSRDGVLVQRRLLGEVGSGG
jgi:hypothetical protein